MTTIEEAILAEIDETPLAALSKSWQKRIITRHLHSLSEEDVASALYDCFPFPDGLARYSRGVKVSPNLPFSRIEEHEKDKLLTQARAVLALIRKDK